MNAPKFAIAKYVRNLTRMETSNFGIVLWNRGEVVGRFVGDVRPDDNWQLGHIGAIGHPAYFQWIEYWRIQFKKPFIKKRDGTSVERTDPLFLDAICESAKDNFVLAPAGKMIDTVAPTRTALVAEDLYQNLVRLDGPKNAKEVDNSDNLRRETNKALDASGLSNYPDFKRTYDWMCPVGDTIQNFRFHFGVHRAKPEAVMQKVNLQRPMSVHDAAFMFQAMQQKYLTKDRCAAIVYAEESDLKSDSVFQAYKMMGALGQVINVADQSQAIKQFAALAV